MIIIENIEVTGWEAAIRGMRNPLNSWNKSDSRNDSVVPGGFYLGHNDLNLAKRLIKAGPEHRKFLRMIHVSMDITAPSFWIPEHDTYKVGTTRNSCSKMHTIHIRPFSMYDFTREGCEKVEFAFATLEQVINTCEKLRTYYNDTKDVKYWRAMLELLPQGYMMTYTWDCSMETILNILWQRDNHKVVEWEDFRQKCLDVLPYCKEFYKAMTGKGD